MQCGFACGEFEFSGRVAAIGECSKGQALRRQCWVAIPRGQAPLRRPQGGESGVAEECTHSAVVLCYGGSVYRVCENVVALKARVVLVGAVLEVSW